MYGVLPTSELRILDVPIAVVETTRLKDSKTPATPQAAGAQDEAARVVRSASGAANTIAPKEQS